MKKLVSNIWLITALVLGFVACTSEVDDVYDKPVSERVSDVPETKGKSLEDMTKLWRWKGYVPGEGEHEGKEYNYGTNNK